MTDVIDVPLPVRVELAHAAVQVLAEQAGVDVLHIKGPAVHPGLRSSGAHAAPTSTSSCGRRGSTR